MSSTMEASHSLVSSRSNPTNKNGQILLSELGPHDVLLGRGTGPNENLGNIRFREILKETMIKCQRDNSVPAVSMKSQIVYEVLSRVKALNGYFVRKLTRDEIRKCSMSGFVPKKTVKDGKKQNFRFVVVPESVAADKTKQSIRFQLSKALNEDPITAKDTAKTSITHAKATISALQSRHRAGSGTVAAYLRSSQVCDPFLSPPGGEGPKSDPAMSPQDSDYGTKAKSFLASPYSFSTRTPETAANEEGRSTSPPAMLASTSRTTNAVVGSSLTAADLLLCCAAAGGSSSPGARSLSAQSGLCASAPTSDTLGLMLAARHQRQMALEDQEQRYSFLQAAVLAKAQQEEQNRSHQAAAASLLSSFSSSLENCTGGSILGTSGANPFAGGQLSLPSSLVSSVPSIASTRISSSDLDRAALLMAVVQQTEDVLRSRHQTC